MMRAPVPKVEKMKPPYIRGYRGTPESIERRRQIEKEEYEKEIRRLKEIREAELEEEVEDEDEDEDEEEDGTPQKSIAADWIQYPPSWKTAIVSYLQPRIKDMIKVVNTFYYPDKRHLDESVIEDNHPTIIAEFTRCGNSFYELCFSHFPDDDNQFIWLYEVFDKAPEPYTISRLVLRRPSMQDVDLAWKRNPGDDSSHDMYKILKHKKCSLKKLHFVYLNNHFYGGLMLFGEKELEDCSCDGCKEYDKQFGRLAQEFRDIASKSDDIVNSDKIQWFEKEPEKLPLFAHFLDTDRWFGPMDFPYRPFKVPRDFLDAPNMLKLAKSTQIRVSPWEEGVLWKFINSWIENEVRDEFVYCDWYFSTEKHPFNFAQLFERFGLEHRANRRLEIKLENTKMEIFSKISIYENKFLFFASPFKGFSDKFNEHFKYCPRQRTLVRV